MAPLEDKPGLSPIAVAEPEVKANSFVSLKNVLFATDFSATSAAALPYAAAAGGLAARCTPSTCSRKPAC